jgi:hypothetical protein
MKKQKGGKKMKSKTIFGGAILAMFLFSVQSVLAACFRENEGFCFLPERDICPSPLFFLYWLLPCRLL